MTTDANTADTSQAASTPQRRVFLVVVDDSPEMPKAVIYACRRARNTGGRVALLHIIEPADFQQWMSVADLMREEQREEAEALIQHWAGVVLDQSGRRPVLHIREGVPRDELYHLLDEDPSICVLVLASSSEGDEPGPLVTHVMGKGLARLRVPLTIVPGGLTDEAISAIS